MSKLNALAISDNGFIFKPSTGESFITNEIGMMIIQQLKEKKAIDEIIQVIIQDYEIDKITAGRDLYEFLDFLKKENLTD